VQQQTKRTLLSILAVMFAAGLLSSGGWATYVWWLWHRGNRFCTTPLSVAISFAFVAIVCFSVLVGTVRLLAKKKNAV